MTLLVCVLLLPREHKTWRPAAKAPGSSYQRNEHDFNEKEVVSYFCRRGLRFVAIPHRSSAGGILRTVGAGMRPVVSWCGEVVVWGLVRRDTKRSYLTPS
jgi:hypothetical protein